jgi:hypothetical protein
VAKSLSLNEIRNRAARFALEWADAPGDERQDAQSFVRDLLGVYGITKTRAAFYEKRSRRSSTGAQGYIDALIPGVALIEMKSAGKDLAEAERQALDYIDALSDPEVPNWVITSDFRRFRILDLAAEGDDVLEFDLAELRDHADRLAFFAGYGQRAFGSKEQERASIDAARLMASLYEALGGSGYDDHEASVFLVRTLFALYADDAGVWERDLFLEFLETRTAEDGSDLGPQLSLLYQVMGREPQRRQTNLDELIKRFPYVNGGIFEEPLSIPSFERTMRERLLAAAMFNWSEISPAIFGSLFQAVKDKKARRELGEHYTTETNIQKLIGPMFLDELRQRFADGFHDAKGLRKLRDDMGRMRLLDPACGCGNFLVVTYRDMRALDLEILQRLQQLGSADVTLAFVDEDLPVRLSSFHGIELEEWPARIAATAMHLVDHQANKAMELALGQAPEALPLDKIETIVVGNALRVDWTSVVPPTTSLHVMGNPPFLGHASRSEEQAQDLRDAWHRKDIGRLDYVTGWYAKSLDLFARDGYDGQFAFVSTNSITQGEPVPALFGAVFGAGWRIKFAHRTFAWTSEAPGAAAVHCVVVGFDRATSSAAWLFDYDELRGEPHRVPVKHGINGYLVDGPRVLVEQRSRGPIGSDLPPMVFGNVPRDGGHLIIERDVAQEFASDPVATKYLRRYLGARELIHSEMRWCLWLVDLDPGDLAKSQRLKSRIDAVRTWRLESKAKQARDAAATPHLFWYRSHAEIPHLMVPSVSSENRLFLPAGRFGPEVISSNLNYTAEDPDGLAFAVISSSLFMTWLRTTGGKLESRLRFSNTQVWNTFPLPALSSAQRSAMIAGGQTVLDARALRPERSLADHYNPLAMAPELLQAHRKLDAAVDAVLGLKGSVDELDRQRALFESYERMIAAGQLATQPKPRTKRAAVKA